MPLKLIRQDITKIKCDAIVNPTNESLCPGGGTDAAIHNASGPRLLEACCELGGIEIGEAKITPAYALPCKYVIHTAGPIWHGGAQNEQGLLEACYTNALALAAQKKCKSIAFPLISSGSFGYPKELVLKVAMRIIGDYLLENEMLVYLVVYDKTAYTLSKKLFADVTAYIDDVYIDTRRMISEQRTATSPKMNSVLNRMDTLEEPEDVVFACEMAPCNGSDLEEMLGRLDKGFAETLFDYIDAKGLTDVECYKRANVDKKTFSKIKCNKNYKPSKVTAVSFAIGLRLNLEETNHLLNTVGMSLSHSSKFDVIIEYFIVSGNYNNIFDVNETLYHFDQVTLGV